MKSKRLAATAAALMLAGVFTMTSGSAQQLAEVGDEAVGRASWYGPKFHGRQTASGERFDMTELTAAHRSLPFDTLVRVTNEANGKSVVVRINDRGPFSKRRIIDLSRRAAEKIGLKKAGVGRVTVEVIESA